MFFKIIELVELCGCVFFVFCIVGFLFIDYIEDELIDSFGEKFLEVFKEDESDDNFVEKVIKIFVDVLSKSEKEVLVLMFVFFGSFSFEVVKVVII